VADYVVAVVVAVYASPRGTGRTARAILELLAIAMFGGYVIRACPAAGDRCARAGASTFFLAWTAADWC
jgi:hypothetical protein